MNIILLGAPFSGKGTLARNMVNEYNLVQISTGDLFRENIKNQTEIGLEAKSYIDKGNLVPDDVTIKMLSDRIAQDDCQNGFILDGFPRSIEQAVALSKIANIDIVILLDVPYSTIEQRVEGRRVCTGCGEIYNTMTYSKTECEKCGSALYQRDDDKLETVRHRLEVYDQITAPLIDFYADILLKVQGADSPLDTFEQVKTLIESRKN
ncbi:MAG: adenylate kinase [Candidatus Gastranaerophilales bacterium]|nr:adenylate kinase [Clostridia bacterium]MBQ8886708.1 adenylate kinase [Candidatus Gastranaerophilales bacterium]